MKDPIDQEPADERDVNRRALLRRGGVIVAATVAGAAAVDALSGGSAQAATGDNLVIGQTNDADTDPTSLTSAVAAVAAPASTLVLENTGDNAPLDLVAQSFDTFTPVAGGELVNLDGFLYNTSDFGDPFGVATGFVFTEFTANQVVTINPQRALDTRTLAGRQNILNPGSGNIDGSGRLVGGRTINIDLSNYEFAAEAAFCNLTAVAPTAAGFMTLFPGGTRPSTSSIDFTAGQTIANFAVTGTSDIDSVSIFSNVTTHVLLDITAFNVGSPAQINPVILSASPATPANRVAARAKAGTVPHWYRGSLKR